jgi:hypothetical protein
MKQEIENRKIAGKLRLKFDRSIHIRLDFGIHAKDTAEMNDQPPLLFQSVKLV